MCKTISVYLETKEDLDVFTASFCISYFTKDMIHLWKSNLKLRETMLNSVTTYDNYII